MPATSPATPLPRLNQRLEVATGDRGGAAQYFSRLVEETADTLRISAPEFEGETLELREGSPMRLWYTQGGGYWCMKTMVRTVYERDGEQFLELSRGGDVHRAQRRNHVRVDVSLLLHARVEQHAGEEEGEASDAPRLTGERIKALTRNISGGGISFRTPEKVVGGDRLVVTFYLPEHGGDITSRAKVVHAHPDPERPEQYIVACSFERMAITDRERIIRFLFFRQRELAGRKKVMPR
ncbi:MAG: type pilus assembly PilZ [Thermoleophilia bacterium]|nr:type pilus assembly PilZ [Thermoleophilia bacterium]